MGLRLSVYLLALTALAIGSTWFLWRVESTLQAESGAQDGSLLTVTSLRMTQFNSDGRPGYTLSAPFAEYLPNDQGTNLRAPTLDAFYPDRSPAATLGARSGWLAHDGQTLTLRGDVRFERWQNSQHPPLTVMTDVLHYRPADQLIDTDRPVVAVTNDVDLRSVGMRTLLNSEQLELLDAVQARFLPAQ